jgi:hypothetical protein
MLLVLTGGKTSEIIALFEKMNANIVSKHCVLRRYALALKTILSYLQDLLDIFIQAIFIRARALNHCVYKHWKRRLGLYTPYIALYRCTLIIMKKIFNYALGISVFT